MWSIFDQSGTIRTPSVAPGLSSQGYPQPLWISFQATFRDSWSSFEDRFIMTFRLRADRFKDRFAAGDTNSTCVPSENCNIQISRTLSPGSITATTPLIVFPIRSWFAFIFFTCWESSSLPACIETQCVLKTWESVFPTQVQAIFDCCLPPLPSTLDPATERGPTSGN